MVGRYGREVYHHSTPREAYQAMYTPFTPREAYRAMYTPFTPREATLLGIHHCTHPGRLPCWYIHCCTHPGRLPGWVYTTVIHIGRLSWWVYPLYIPLRYPGVYSPVYTSQVPGCIALYIPLRYPGRYTLVYTLSGTRVGIPPGVYMPPCVCVGVPAVCVPYHQQL